ncbi:XdhC family protein [Actinoplanes sp. NPDC049265]|uniref:XdhC family protein n=1 Tax=Actinoplanes sp. NPDC049265 TaxID=3363902 RepID=UPI00371CE8FE
MREIASGLAAWRAAGVRFALATVVRTFNSAPRGPGAAMAVAETGEVLGSVSGGCVEGAVYELAQAALTSGESTLRQYGVSADEAFEVGLTCGGTIDILIQPAGDPAFGEVLDAIRAGRPVALVTAHGHHLVVRPGGWTGDLGDPELTRAAGWTATGMLAQGRTAMIEVCGDAEVFVQSYAPPPRMLIFGANDFAAAVARIGEFLGYHVVVCDARPVFATGERFPAADEVVVQWPHRYLETAEVDERTVICVLTHDPKFDVPLLEAALRTPARYIGVMGSRRTHAYRRQRLLDLGVPHASLDRLAAPIGLDLGARTPEETAVAIAAEIIALTGNGTGRRLTELHAPIHR